MRLLVKGLGHPQGIAIDQKRQLLLVADSLLHKVVSYGLWSDSDGLKVDDQTAVVENIEEPRWVAVDGSGNIYVTDEARHQVLKLTAQQVLDGDTSAMVLFPVGPSQEGLAAPGGVAADNFFLYWTNKNALGVGTVVRRLEGHAHEVLASNLPKAYGLCLGTNLVYYTDTQGSVFAAQRTGGGVRTLTNALKSPRGCVWDGHSTVYVADREANAVFALQSSMSSNSHTTVRKAVDFDGAFGVAVFSAASRRSVAALILVVAWVL